jgi:hypothetical protein
MIPVVAIDKNFVTIQQPTDGQRCNYSVKPAWWKRRITCDHAQFNGGRFCIDHSIANLMARRCRTCNGCGFLAGPLVNTRCGDCDATGLDTWVFGDTTRGITQRAHPQSISAPDANGLYHIKIKKL